MSKKGILALSVVIGLAGIFFYFNHQTQAPSVKSPELTAPVLSVLPHDIVMDPQRLLDDPTLSTVEVLASLNEIKAQCRKMNGDFSAQIGQIHQIIITALEQSLKDGKTVRELLAYEGQYTTHYNGFDDLLLKAQVNLAREKLTITSDVSVLANWQGLDVINGFNQDVITSIVTSMGGMTSARPAMTMKFEIKPDITADDLALLLSNQDNFNTYLDTFIQIENTAAISPSMLFVAIATQMSIEDFTLEANAKTFTVNDVALAIRNQLPSEYIEVLLNNTTAYDEFPAFIQDRDGAGIDDRGGTYYNLADVAVSEFDLATLKLLANKGVKPTNEPGIFTAMDIALLNLPENQEELNGGTSLNQYIDTLTYLKKQGYKAHGVAMERANQENEVHFRPPYLVGFRFTTPIKGLGLEEVINDIELIDDSTSIVPAAVDDSLVSQAIIAADERKQQLAAQRAPCGRIEQDLHDAQQFATPQSMVEIVKSLMKQEVDVGAELHRIDPALITVWHQQLLYQNQRNEAARVENEFKHLIKQNRVDEAVIYASTYTLTQSETDFLLHHVVKDESLTIVWLSRMLPKKPSGLSMFGGLPLNKWQSLQDEKFDFALEDTWGNDLFTVAAQKSVEHVDWLLKYGLKPNMDMLGLDPFDLALEDSYKQRKLTQATIRLSQFVDKIEPSHLARIARLKVFFPEEYQALTDINKQFMVTDEIEMNQYRQVKMYF